MVSINNSFPTLKGKPTKWAKYKINFLWSIRKQFCPIEEIQFSASPPQPKTAMFLHVRILCLPIN